MRRIARSAKEKTANGIRHIIAGGVSLLLTLALVPGGTSLAYAEPGEGESVLADSLYTAQRPTGALVDPDMQQEYNYTDEDRQASTATPEVMPSAYDSRELGLITPVKLQSPWGTCWSFAATAALEASAIKYGLSASESTDFSERHMAWFVQHPLQSTSQAGEGTYLPEPEWIPFEGDYSSSVITALASGIGIASEEEFPYKNKSNTMTEYPIRKGDVVRQYGNYLSSGSTATPEQEWGLDEENRFTSELQLKEAHIIPSPATYEEGGYFYDNLATDAMKRELLKYGALDIVIEASFGVPDENNVSESFNFNDWALFNRSSASISPHAVAVVGWDDSFPKEKFMARENGIPEGDGAWIVKNSWGAQTETLPNCDFWGTENDAGENTGYFYLSYYDRSIADVTSFELEQAPYDHVAQYDYLGFKGVGIDTFTTAVPTATIAANVFTAESDQVLTSISANAYNPNSRATFQVYRLGADGISPADGEIALEQQAFLPYAGYYRVELEEPVSLPAGEKYAIAVSVAARGQVYAPVEATSGGTGHGYYAHAVLNLGESFAFDQERGGWVDMTEYDGKLWGGSIDLGNVMVKAFTEDADAPVPVPDPVPDPTPDPVPDPAQDPRVDPAASGGQRGPGTVGYLAPTDDETNPEAVSVLFVVSGVTLCVAVYRLRRKEAILD